MESGPDKREGASESVKLPELLRRAIYDDDVRNLIFDDPAKAVATYRLSKSDTQKLMNTSRAEFDGMLGKFVTYKILPTPIGEQLLVKPVNGMVPRAEGRLEIILDQSATGANLGARGTSKNKGRVFGCGTHPTTRLSVHMMERYLRPDMRVLDLGTGSGILALAAVKLNASEVIGLERS
jgi:ribosomal protein L11 methylase PrmA